jgi:hypothetical protein
MDVPHCPLIGAQTGFVRAAALKPRLVDILHDSHPLFFPAGELVIVNMFGLILMKKFVFEQFTYLKYPTFHCVCYGRRILVQKISLQVSKEL